MFVYLPTLTHYAWVSYLLTKDINLTHQGQLLTPDSQIRTSCSKNTSFHFRFVMYYFFPLIYNNRESFQMSIIRLNWKCSKVVRISSDIVGNVRKSMEMARMFSENYPSHDETKISRVWLRKSGQYMFVLYTPKLYLNFQLSVHGLL